MRRLRERKIRERLRLTSRVLPGALLVHQDCLLLVARILNHRCLILTERPWAYALSPDEHDDILLAHRHSSCKDPADRISPGRDRVSMYGDYSRGGLDLSRMAEIALFRNQLRRLVGFNFPSCSGTTWATYCGHCSHLFDLSATVTAI